MEHRDANTDKKHAPITPRSGPARWEGLTILHPVLFALFSPISFLAVNIQETHASAAYRSLILAVLAAFGLLLSFRVIFRSWHKAGVLATLTLVLFFSYGHMYALLKTMSIAGLLVGRHRFLLPAFTLVGLVAAWFLIRKEQIEVSASRILFLAGVVSLISPTIVLVEYAIQFRIVNASNPSLEIPAGDVSWRGGEGNLPDVYYIILDSYAAPDLLRDEFGYDNSALVSFLEAQGFYVARQATSNYTLTGLSLASSLNMQHLLQLYAEEDKSDYPLIMAEPIRRSKTRLLLEEFGYSTVAIASRWKATEITDADLYLKPEDSQIVGTRESGGINAFESLYIRTTGLLALIDLGSETGLFELESFKAPFVVRHYFVLAQFDYLTQTVSLPSPKFVFAHIISPHGPYVFGPNGELIASAEAFTLGEDTISTRPRDIEVSMYRDQTEFITKKTIETIEAILDTSESTPIILLQSDHGPNFSINWGAPSEQSIIERTSILNAYLLPEPCGEYLYPSITPVNTFAVMFTCVFGVEAEFNEDRNYFSAPRDAFNFKDVTEIVQ